MEYYEAIKNDYVYPQFLTKRGIPQLIFKKNIIKSTFHSIVILKRLCICNIMYINSKKIYTKISTGE